MQNNFSKLGKDVPRRTHSPWRWLTALLMLLALSATQVWAATPDYESYDWDATEVAAIPGTHDGITITSSGLGGVGNVSGHYYIPINQNLKNSDSQWKFLGISATSQIDSIEVLYCPNGSNQTNVAWAAWGSGVTPTQKTLGHGVTAGTKSSKSWDNAVWEKINLSSISAYTVYLSRSIREFQDNDGNSISNFGAGQTINVLGLRVWLHPSSSGPVDPTLTFNDGVYTLGTGVDLDLSTLVSASNSDGAITYSVKSDPDGTGAYISGTIFIADAPGTVVVTASQAATSSYNAKSVDFNVVVSEPVTPECPSVGGITGWEEYDQGQPIELTVYLTAGNGDITYTWYKSATNDLATAKAGGAIATGAVYSKAHCELGDEGFYFCVATKDACSESASTGFEIIGVHPMTACAELYPATSGASPTAKNEELLLQSVAPNASFGGKIYTAGAKDNNWSASFTYTANGLQLNKGGADSARVELTHLMQVGTVITATLVNPDASKARGYKLLNMSKTVKATWQATTTDPQTYTYTVVAGDGLAGTNMFLLNRAESSALKELKVSNCGAELYAINTAFSPAEAEGKATITLSANPAAAGASVTATASAFDPAWEFDSWQINNATLSDASTNPTTITMGSGVATLVLVLKAAGVKHTVTYYDDATELGTELVDDGGHPTGAGLAPRKLGYTFLGWRLAGSLLPSNLNEIAITANQPLYAVWEAVDCSAASGTIFSLVMDVTPAANCTIRSGSGYEEEADLDQYAAISGGIAIAKNSSTSNHLIITTTPTVKFAGGNGKVHIQFDCPLQAGDKILTTISSQNIAYTTTDSRSTTNYFTKGTDQELTITEGHPLENASEIYLWAASSNGGELTSINVVRPAKFEVTFNMHNHGDAVNPQYIVEGGKVSAPGTASISGWDFGGWYKEATFDNEWDFDNDVVHAATELHAKWTAHTTSSDATLKDLTVNGVTVAGFDPATEVYNVVLEMGTTTSPEVGGVANDDNVISVVVWQTTDPADGATVTVTAEDNSTTKTYTINFSIATSKDIELVWDKSKKRCDDTTPAANVKSDDASVSAYINKITFTGGGAEGSSLNVGNTAGNMLTLSAKAGYAFQAMSFFGKIESDDAKLEFSLNGGDWADLASTSAGDACYANVFSAAEVHELRMRSAGNKGFWIRNMQLTMIEACMPVDITWDEEPIEFEVGKAGYAIAATANNGGTIAYGSSDASVIAVDAGNGVLSVSDLGSTTLSASTPEGDGTTFCENGGNDIVISKVVNTYFLVTLDAQNGEAPAEIKFFSGDAAIAKPSDPVFAGHTFLEWQDANNEPIGWPLTPDASLTLHATWQSDCNAPQIVEHPESANYFTGRAAVALECQATAQNNPDGELSYVWYSCDNASRENPVALSGAPTPSTAVAGTFYFYCDVTEESCANVAHSDVAVITVADKDPICLAWVDVTGQNAVALDENKSLFAPEVSAANLKGSSPATIYEGKTGYKFNSSPAYIAIEGAPFKSGDIVEMFVAGTTADKARVFNANEAVAANIIAEGAANMVLGANRVTLTADANSLYLRRGNDFGGWNPFVAYVAVYRACAPILNKVTVASVEGTPDNTNHVAIEVPNSTADADLDAIVYDWVSNDADWTASHSPAVANAWEWGVENTVTLTDKDGDASVYYVTISKAAASSDASLASLTVNGQNVEIVPDQLVYNVELPYGTSVAPVVAATANHSAAVANVIECDLNSAIIEVVPESGVDDKVEYTINFTISKWQEVVIWDGSYMTELATSPGTLGMAWETVGFGSIASYNTTYGEKAYTKYLPSGGAATSRYMTLTVPEGYVAKFYVVMASHSDGNERGMYIGSNLVKNPDATSVLQLSNNDRDEAVAGMSEIVGAGTWYINPNASIDFQEIRAYLRPGFARTDMVGNGVLGTVCLDHNVAAEDVLGASVYELAGRIPPYGKLAFDEIVAGQMDAGVPHVFQAHGNRVVFFYGEQTADEPQNQGNGIYGTFTEQVFSGDELEGMYYFAERALWSCKDISSLTVPANRAYVILSEVPDANPDPAPGRRRIVFDVHGEQTATDVENINNASEQPQKLMINGKIFILRGEKLFDATGRLVK